MAWLVENTYNNTASGAKANTYGTTNYEYWTLSPVSDYARCAWYVDNDGSLSYYNVDLGSNYGVRPVITVLKSDI